MKDNQWKVIINYVPFESEEKRSECYEKWVESFFKINKKNTKTVPDQVNKLTAEL